MKVLKFGGTSVANADNIRKVIQIAGSQKNVLVVVSALGGVTDLLLDAVKLAAAGNDGWKDKINLIEERHTICIHELIKGVARDPLLFLLHETIDGLKEICQGVKMIGELTPRLQDRMAGTGEWLSSQIITVAFQEQQLDAIWGDAASLIVTNSNYGNAAVDFEVTYKKIREFAVAHTNELIVFPGFVAKDKNGVPTTLGRGGSDYTAAILAAALQADSLEIWTDVSGMMTADPRICSHAKIISDISYQEAMELSHFGAKIIYPPTIQPVMHHHIPVWVKNTFAPEDHGTCITAGFRSKDSDKKIITGISSMNSISLLTLEGSGMIGIPGFSKRLFEALSGAQVNVILITQSSSEHSITVAIHAADAEKAERAVHATFQNEIALQIVDPLIVEHQLAIVAVVGDQMRYHTGVSGRMFSAMGRNGINIRAIAQGSSEKNISAVIDVSDVRKTINVLHEEFFENTYKQINVFLAGTGNVAGKLLAQLLQQKEFLKEKLGLQLRVAGIINSRRMLIEEQGIDLQQWQQKLQDGEPAELNSFLQALIGLNLRNSMLVDITASDHVASIYNRLLEKSISVVACNKIAAASAYEDYHSLKKLSKEYNAQFLFETNVGAGLPVIGTINDLIHSGDRICSIQAVLSGTLNFVFNQYDGKKSFASVVRQAQTEGYTEPDPRLDLSGTDVMRKILILAREAGEKLEMPEIENRTFMPEACMKGSIDDFYAAMEAHESHFQTLFAEANNEGKKLKFVASYENGRASVGLQAIGEKSDLYHLYGKDNIVLFYTDRYQQQPLVIKGAGAGAEVTASGVFADIIRASKG